MSETAAISGPAPVRRAGTIRRSVAFSALDRYVGQILQILTTAVMARILTPAETGLFLVAQAVVLLADNFRTFGVGAYLVQQRDLRPEMIRSAFTVTLLLSLAVGAAIGLGANVIADLYGSPELAFLLFVASLNFALLPFASPSIALMQRDLDFRTLAAINVAAALANTVTTIALGLLGFGAVSFVWGYIASGAALALLATALRGEFWIFRPSLEGARALLSFGTISTAVTVVNMAYDMLPRLALGRILGFDAVGLFARAVTTCQLPERAIISALQPVVLPAMAERVRRGQNIKDAFLRGHALVSGIQWPALMMLALLANPVVHVLLGSQWGTVPDLVRVMAIAMMALAPAFMTYPLLVSVGRIRDALTASLISLPPSVLIMIAASRFGLEAVAASMLVTAPLQMTVALYFIRRNIGLTVAEFWAASRKSIALTVLTAGLPGLVILTSPSGFEIDTIRTILAVVGGAAGWGAGLWILEHPFADEIRRARGMLSSR